MSLAACFRSWGRYSVGLAQFLRSFKSSALTACVIVFAEYVRFFFASSFIIFVRDNFLSLYLLTFVVGNQSRFKIRYLTYVIRNRFLSYLHISLSPSFPLSLSLYIYIYIHIYSDCHFFTDQAISLILKRAPVGTYVATWSNCAH